MSSRLPYFSATASALIRFEGVGEVEVDAAAEVADLGADAAALVADVLGLARRDVARHEVAERGVDPLEVVVAVLLGDLARVLLAVVAAFFGTQMRPSLRSDSDMSVSLLWCSPATGMQVGWICV